MNRLFVIALSIAMAAATTLEAQVSTFTVPTISQCRVQKGQTQIGPNSLVVIKGQALSDARDLLIKGLSQHSDGDCARATTPIELSITRNSKLGDEGYTINVSSKKISIQSQKPQGIIWGIQSLLQMAEENNGQIPCCRVQDKPDYRLRGYMIDCGRRYIPMDYLYSLVRTMSYYKMNTLQVHLNDNGFKKYFHNNWDETYAAFRLESERFPELTAKDGYYTKDEFRTFVKESAKLGVEIIPEIDVPAHSLAFTHFRKSLGCEEFGVDHFDLTNPEVVPFLDSLFVEYLEGPDPVFAGPRVHCGTDEYSNKKQEVVELFRGLTDHLVKLIESYNKQAVIWGSLTYAKGETQVKHKNVLMDIWNNGYADPKQMKEDGYQLVSIPDGYVYIVPAAGYYYDYLNDQFLYEHWTPANIGGVQLKEKDPQIEGGMFAVWNDVCGNGISLGDIHHRTFPALQVIAQKCWHAVNDTVGYGKWNAQRKAIGEGAGVNELGRNIKIDIAELQPCAPVSVSMNPNDVGVIQIGYNYEVSFDITWANEEMGTALTTSPRSTFYLKDPISGMMGFSRDGYLYTFNYSGKPGKTEHLAIRGTNRSTELWVNGKLYQKLGYDQHLSADKTPYDVVRTLVFPLQETGRFRSVITNFKTNKI